MDRFLEMKPRPFEIDRLIQYSSGEAGGWIGSNSETKTIYLSMSAPSMKSFVHFLEWVVGAAQETTWLPEDCDA